MRDYVSINVSICEKESRIKNISFHRLVARKDPKEVVEWGCLDSTFDEISALRVPKFSSSHELELYLFNNPDNNTETLKLKSRVLFFS
jgi:hypothetical protein